MKFLNKLNGKQIILKMKFNFIYNITILYINVRSTNVNNSENYKKKCKHNFILKAIF